MTEFPAPVRRAIACALAVLLCCALSARAQVPDTTARRDTLRPVMPRPPRPDTLHPAAGSLPSLPDLGIHLQTRIETKGERVRNERCSASQLLDPFANCRGRLQPDFDLQFFLKSAGTIGDRIHVDVDYDTKREFDASQTISIFYQGEKNEKLQRFELGNVNFTPPASRFITAGIPSGSYGAQLVARLGPMRLRAIGAQQKGNVVQSRVFTVGERTLQGNEREVDDYQVEARRFFFTVDPRLFPGYPNVDVLDRAQLNRIRAALPDTLRPTRVLLYRLQFGSQPADPNGPRLQLVDGDRSGVTVAGRQTYDLLREGVDYYLDKSNLWFSLVRPLNANSERLVVAYFVRLPGSTRDTIWTTTGGTPDVAARADGFGSLVWDPRILPGTPAFRKEIRSVYRIGGADLQRASVRLRVVAGTGNQEQPSGGGAATYLQMFGLARANSDAEFDVDNRLWPRPGDGLYNTSTGASSGTTGNVGAQIISDYFLFFPSLQPFAERDSGLVVRGNPSNPAIYSTPGEYLYSPQHPPSVYRILARYDAAGGTVAGSLDLGSIQIRPGSERILLDGRSLTRDVDYRVDYETGRVAFLRADTLFLQPRTVEVKYEENPLFAPSPTTLYGLVSEFPFTHGQLAFTALSQSQRTTFSRPGLGFEPTSALLAGVTGELHWAMPALSRWLSNFAIPGAARIDAAVPSRFGLQGELATSRPIARASNQAYLESFESDAGLPVDLGDIHWYYASVPPNAHAKLPAGFTFDTTNAASLAWQTNVTFDGRTAFSIPAQQIDPEIVTADLGLATPEQLLWLSLYPDTVGRFRRNSDVADWAFPKRTASSRRWRSIRTVLSPTGIDLSRSDYLEFWALVDRNAAPGTKNPTLVVDIGDISEASLAFRPETLYIRANGDSLYHGRRWQHRDSLDTERDPFSHAFNVGVNDAGLPGDLLDTVVVVDSTRGGAASLTTRLTMCRGFYNALLVAGDTRTDCTAGNNRLDEEDIDLDEALNLRYDQRESEGIRRYVVDLGDPARWVRTGGEFNDFPDGSTRQWVLIRLPLDAPTDTLGRLELRRVRALRLSVISAPNTGNDLTQIALARMGFRGTAWIKRSDVAVRGIGGATSSTGAVLTSLIGTNDYDPSRGVYYEAPPGYRNELQSRGQQGAGGTVQINERSLRIQAVNLQPLDRAEAYYRFPGGQQNFMSYEELRLWARGRGHGWGAPDGELQMFVKIGRDDDNFYLYRAPANEGADVSAWNPEVHVQFQKFFDLRRRLQNAYLNPSATPADSVSCTGLDAALIAASGLPLASGRTGARFAACDGSGYIVYTLDPAITPPNLAAVQEMSVGILRVSDGAGAPSPIAPNDTLELWVDEIRLAHPVGSPGFAGQVGLSLTAGDFADIRVNVVRRDPHFRQVSEQPSFVDDRTVQVTGTFRLDKLLPLGDGFALPLTVTRTSSAAAPLFLAQSDIRGRGIPGLRAPRSAVTTYSLTVKRSRPLGNTILGPLLDNLAATTTYADGDSRNEYQTGTSRHFTVGLDYLVADSARTARFPGVVSGVLGLLPQWLQGGPIGALRNSVIRWNPTQLRLTSGVVRSTDRRFSFSRPVEIAGDDPRQSLALTNVWRNASVLELHPSNGLTARWELASTRDLRQYGDSNASAVVASAQRGKMFGGDAGFERERGLQTSLNFTPQFSAWFRPRAQFGTQYSMLRDPNARFLLPKPGVVGVDSLLAHLDSLRFEERDSIAGALTLPRRLMATQNAGAGVTIDLAKLFLPAGDTARRPVRRRLSGLFAPVDVSVDRTLLGAYDAAAFAPPLGMQFGFGGPTAFRRVGETPASSAGATTNFVATAGVSLPFGTSLTSRYRHTLTRNWTLRSDTTQARIDGAQTVFPDVSLRWTLRPLTLERVLRTLNLTAGYSVAGAASSVPVGLDVEGGATALELRERRTTHVESWPISTSIAWGFGGNLYTAAGLTLSRRVDSLPGSLTRGSSNDLNLDVGRSFRLPRSVSLGLRNDVRTRLSWQRSATTNTVYELAGDNSSRLGDLGRNSLTLNADTDVGQGMTFTFQAARVITFDRNLNRRVNQFVLSTVLQMEFFGGRQ